MAEATTRTRRWRVPRLGGALLALYRVAWLCLLAGALVCTVYLAPRDERQVQSAVIATTALGFQTYRDPTARGVLGGPFGAEGRRIGYPEGDLLVALDGRRVAYRIADLRRFFAGPPGAVATLTVRRGDALVAVRATRDPTRLARAYAGCGITFQSRRWIAFAVLMLAAVASLLAAALLFVRRPRDPVAQLLSVSLLLGQVGYLGAPVAYIAWQAVVGDVLLMLAVLLFPGRRFATRWHWLALLVVLAGGAVQIWSFVTSSITLWGSLIYVMPLLTVLFAVDRQRRRTPRGVERQQTKFVLLGVTSYCLLRIAGNLFAEPQFGGLSAGANGWLILAAQCSEALAGVAIPAGLLVSLLRYRLYDAEATISRSIAYAAMTVSLLGIFAASEKVIELLGERWFGESLGALAGGLGAALAAVSVAPLHHRVTRWAEKRFRGGLVRLRVGLPLLVGDLRETVSPAALADAMLAHVERGVRARHGAVVVGDTILDARDLDPRLVRDWLDAGRGPGGERGLLHV
ncbi:hypothetical protein, partial [Sphingomonas bacterium]|uniref:hypothetical protein n=1 Tax=Sphingomonas bacterium TaxID=1895847 RepID=UPI001C2D865D